MNNRLANKIKTKEWARNKYEYETSETLNEKPNVLNIAPTALNQMAPTASNKKLCMIYEKSRISPI